MKTLASWREMHSARMAMIWKGNAEMQLNSLARLEPDLLKYDHRAKLQVIGEHQCKRILLPVIMIEFPSLGLVIYARNNFYSWAISVKCRRPIQNLDTTGMDFLNVAPGYFEGFERSDAPLYEGGYAANQSQFSFLWDADNYSIKTVVSRLIGALKASSN